MDAQKFEPIRPFAESPNHLSIRLFLLLFLLGFTLQDGSGDPASIRIGLFIPLRGERATEGREVQRAAEMAIAEANREGGFQGRPFELIVRGDDGLWGAGSRELIKLAFQDGVWAILGSVDAASAHLTAQIATKAQVVFLTPWVTDPTLTQAGTYWVLRGIPDDRQGANALVREIFAIKGLRRIGVVTTAERDQQMAADTFIRMAAQAGHPIPQNLRWRLPIQSVPSLKHASLEGIVLFAPIPSAINLVQTWRNQGLTQPIFGPLALHSPEFLGAITPSAEVITLSPTFRSFSIEQFNRDYQIRYGTRPNPIAAYSYDSARAIIQAIRKGGLCRRAIRDALADLEKSAINSVSP